MIGLRLRGFATNLTEYSAEIIESLRVPKSERVMNELDLFVVSFGVAFFLASDRCKQLLAWLGFRKAP
jgi:hypothetical protein